MFPGPVLPCLIRETFLCLLSGIVAGAMELWGKQLPETSVPPHSKEVAHTAPLPTAAQPWNCPREQPPGHGTQPWASPGAEAELRTVRLCAFSTSPGTWGSVSVG